MEPIVVLKERPAKHGSDTIRNRLKLSSALNHKPTLTSCTQPALHNKAGFFL